MRFMKARDYEKPTDDELEDYLISPPGTDFTSTAHKLKPDADWFIDSQHDAKMMCQNWPGASHDSYLSAFKFEAAG